MSHTHTHYGIHTISDSFFCTVHHLHDSIVLLWLQSISLWIVYIKHDHLYYTFFKLVPAQHLSLLPKRPSFPQKHLGCTFRTDILAPTSSIFPLSTYTSALMIHCSCATFHSLFHIPAMLYFLRTPAESQQRNNLGIFSHLSHVRPQTHLGCTDPSRVLIALQ